MYHFVIWHYFSHIVDMEVDFWPGLADPPDDGMAEPQVDRHGNGPGFGTVGESPPAFAPSACGFLGGVLPPWR